MAIDSFDGQRPDEDIAAIWRQHPWVMSRRAFLGVGLVALGAIPQAAFSPPWGVKLLLLFALGGILCVVSAYYLWLNTIYILTNQRILAVSQKGIFHRATNEVPLANIQNVSHIKKGLFQTVFDFGDVEIETSGAKTAMVLSNAEKPYLVQQKILSRDPASSGA